MKNVKTFEDFLNESVNEAKTYRLYMNSDQDEPKEISYEEYFESGTKAEMIKKAKEYAKDKTNQYGDPIKLAVTSEDDIEDVVWTNESVQLNEGLFQYTSTAVKIAKDLVKKHEALPMNAENFEKIQAALKKLDFQSYSVHGRIVKATKYTKYLQNEFEGKSSIFRGYRYLFDSSGNLKYIIEITGGAGQDMGELIYIDGKDKGQDAESWAYENYPKLFKDVTWEVYEYSDHNRGWGNAGTVEFVTAPTEKLAKERTTAPGSDRHDPFWIDHGIQAVTQQEVTKKKKEIKDLALHYAKLAKQMGV